MPEISHARGSFRLWSDTLDPELVTCRLSIKPSEAWAKDDVWTGRRTGREYRRPTGMWWLGSTLPEEHPLEEHLAHLLDQLHPHSRVVQDFLNQGCQAEFFCGLFL